MTRSTTRTRGGYRRPGGSRAFGRPRIVPRHAFDIGRGDEDEHHAIKTSGHSPLETLKFLMEEQGMTAANLGKLPGERTLGPKILRVHPKFRGEYPSATGSTPGRESVCFDRVEMSASTVPNHLYSRAHGKIRGAVGTAGPTSRCRPTGAWPNSPRFYGCTL